MITVEKQTYYFAKTDVKFSITADQTGTIKYAAAYRSANDGTVQIYKGQLYMYENKTIIVDFKELYQNLFAELETDYILAVLKFGTDNINDSGQEEHTAQLLNFGKSKNADSFIYENKIIYKTGNWLPTVRTTARNVTIPETELIDYKQFIINANRRTLPYAPDDTELFEDDNSGNILKLKEIHDGTQSGHIENIIKVYTAPVRATSLRGVVYKRSRLLDFTIYITEAIQTNCGIWRIKFKNCFNQHELCQLTSLKYTPEFEERSTYKRYNTVTGELDTVTNALKRTDTFTASVGIVDADRLNFVLNMLQSDETELITPSGNAYKIQITPEANTLDDTRETPIELTFKIQMLNTEDFPLLKIDTKTDMRIFNEIFNETFN